jgi:hypothetical protein
MPRSVDAQSHATLEWLRSTRGLAIPVYQRDYRWDEATCDQLLADVRRIADADDKMTHFIGSVLVTPDSDDGDFTLVDGQQRVTTLMLLIAAVRTFAAADSAEIMRETQAILARPGSGTETKLRPHQRHEDVLSEILLGTSSIVGDSSFETNYAFLLEQIGDWRQVWRGLQRLEHVVIRLRKMANAQQIFESLNATGARLSDDELIHNYVHMGRGHAEQLELEHETWIPLEEATAGATRSFWRDFLVMTAEKHPDLTGEFAIYRAFRDRYPDARQDITPDVREQWVRLAQRYGTLLHPEREPDAEVAEQLRLVQAFDGTPRPLLLRMYDDYLLGSLSKVTFVETVEQLQTMFIRMAVVDLDRDLRMVGTLCRELGSEGYPIAGLVHRTPVDAQVRLALSHGRLPHSGYVLSRLQQASTGLGPLHVEHIYPQNPRSDWSGGGERWGDLSLEIQGRYRNVLNTIGNLTLLEERLNIGASNRSFRDKATYYAQSQIPATYELATHHAAWDHAAIENRTKELTEWFLRQWPRVGDQPMTEPDELVPLVDVPQKPIKGYPDMFEYATFRTDDSQEPRTWYDAKNVKQLLVKLAHELWLIDPERLKATKYGGHLQKERSPRQKYVRLPSGLFLYTGWSNQYLLEVAKEFTIAFALEDQVRVKLLDPAEEVPDLPRS